MSLRATLRTLVGAMLVRAGARLLGQSAQQAPDEEAEDLDLAPLPLGHPVVVENQRAAAMRARPISAPTPDPVERPLAGSVEARMNRWRD